MNIFCCLLFAGAKFKNVKSIFISMTSVILVNIQVQKTAMRLKPASQRMLLAGKTDRKKFMKEIELYGILCFVTVFMRAFE